MRFEQSRFVLAGGCLTLVVVAAACSTPPAPAAPETPVATEASAADQIERGRLLIIGGGCHDCHTPKKMGPAGPEVDFDRSLSGHPQDKVITAGFKGASGPWSTHTSDDLTAWSGAWGVTFAANITSDENTGIGVWTEEMFVTAMKTGKHMGRGRQILPPMPWNFIGQLPDESLKAMYAYLKSTKPISNRVPVPLGPDDKPIEAP
jgi:mono/diheme cytochrome c family protein